MVSQGGLPGSREHTALVRGAWLRGRSSRAPLWIQPSLAKLKGVTASRVGEGPQAGRGKGRAIQPCIHTASTQEVRKGEVNRSQRASNGAAVGRVSFANSGASSAKGDRGPSPEGYMDGCHRSMFRNTCLSTS